jgi:L-asparagine transporter-like permease
MNDSIVAGIIGLALTFLFVAYAKNKKRHVSPMHQVIVKKPDIISRAARGIYAGHKIHSNIMAVVIIGAVVIGSFFDPLMRMIVLSTITVMLLVALIYIISRRRRAAKKSPPRHVQIID